MFEEINYTFKYSIRQEKRYISHKVIGWGRSILFRFAQQISTNPWFFCHPFFVLFFVYFATFSLSCFSVTLFLSCICEMLFAFPSPKVPILLECINGYFFLALFYWEQGHIWYSNTFSSLRNLVHNQGVFSSTALRIYYFIIFLCDFWRPQKNVKVWLKMNI